MQTKKLLLAAQAGNYAVGAFNINNMEIAHAIVEAAEREHAPVICQTSEGSLKYAGMDMLLAIARQLAEKSKIPVSLHLDHGKHPEVVKEANLAQIRKAYQILPTSDAPILAAALKAKPDVLVTWDTHDLLRKEVKDYVSFPILIPGDFVIHYLK